MTAPAQANPARARQILLVDDEVEFTSLFKEFLLRHRPGAWVVHTADHYAPALACLKEHPVDLVVLDLRMPIMDGLQLLTLLKRTHPGLPVVILTSSPTPENRAQALQGGAALFFSKLDVAQGLESIYPALESVISAPAEGFRGVLRQVGLPDVLQMECLGRKSSILEISSRKGSGKVFIREGSLVHAEIGTLQGEKAFFQLLGLGEGEFQLKPYTNPPRQTIDGPWESLVMEAARLHDEATAGSAAAAEPAAASAPAPMPPPAAERCINEIVLCSNTSELMYEWQGNSVEHRLQMLQQLARLAGALAQSLGQSRVDRLEVETREDRCIMLLQPDRRVFIRSGAQPATRNPK